MLILCLAGCGFAPDLSRFEPCDRGQCRAGFLCLTEEQRCVPECGERCASADAGADADAGPALALAAGALPPAIETKPYAHTFQPTGGQGAYSFSMAGSVPGFSLSVGGQLSTAAAPTPGTFPFTITVQDDAVPRALVSTNFSLQVRPVLRVASFALVEGRQSQVYSEQLSATGGQPPYRWVVDGGMPPGGVSLTVDGGLQGSPSATGIVSFGVSVVDSATPPQQASRMVTVETKLLDVVLAIATDSAVDGRVGTPYSQLLKAYGGSTPYTWAISTGSASLPPGIALTNAGTVWQLSGTPTVAGTFPFTVRVTDQALGNQSLAVNLTVY